jgi:hypothetical protein
MSMYAHESAGSIRDSSHLFFSHYRLMQSDTWVKVDSRDDRVQVVFY